MIFNPHVKSKIVCDNFPNFILDGQQLSFVSSFRYLGHIVENNTYDDLNIKREMLFKSFCICFYDRALWMNYSKTMSGRMKSCCTECVKSFFNFHKYSSVTEVFMYLGLPIFDTIVHNSQLSLFKRVSLSSNSLIFFIGEALYTYHDIE